MSKICISYRRSDSQAMTGRIFDRLCAHYGKDAVFMDIDKIPAGIDFRQYLSNTLLKAQVVLAIVGQKWHGGGRGGTDRIQDENDPVRIEVETALYGGVPIIPVLIGQRKMPTLAQMPAKLKEFIYLNAVTVDPGVDFDHHMQRLFRAIDATLASKVKSAESTRRRQDTGSHVRVSDDRSRLTTKERERLAARATEARSIPPPAVLEKQDASLLDRFSWLPPAMRLPFVAGAALLCVALIVGSVLLLGPSDQTTAAAANGPALSSVPPPSTSTGSPGRNDVVQPAVRHYSPPPVVLPRQQ
jgi:hypothetical protein